MKTFGIVVCILIALTWALSVTFNWLDVTDIHWWTIPLVASIVFCYWYVAIAMLLKLNERFGDIEP